MGAGKTSKPRGRGWSAGPAFSDFMGKMCLRQDGSRRQDQIWTRILVFARLRRRLPSSPLSAALSAPTAWAFVHGLSLCLCNSPNIRLVPSRCTHFSSCSEGCTPFSPYTSRSPLSTRMHGHAGVARCIIYQTVEKSV